MDFEITVKFCNDQEGFNFDFSLFEEFKDKNTWVFEIMTNKLVRESLLKKYYSLDNNLFKAFSAEFKIDQCMEPDPDLFERA